MALTILFARTLLSQDVVSAAHHTPGEIGMVDINACIDNGDCRSPHSECEIPDLRCLRFGEREAIVFSLVRIVSGVSWIVRERRREFEVGINRCVGDSWILPQRLNDRPLGARHNRHQVEVHLRGDGSRRLCSPLGYLPYRTHATAVADEDGAGRECVRVRARGDRQQLPGHCVRIARDEPALERTRESDRRRTQ